MRQSPPGVCFHGPPRRLRERSGTTEGVRFLALGTGSPCAGTAPLLRRGAILRNSFSMNSLLSSGLFWPAVVGVLVLGSFWAVNREFWLVLLFWWVVSLAVAISLLSSGLFWPAVVFAVGVLVLFPASIYISDGIWGYLFVRWMLLWVVIAVVAWAVLRWY